MFFSWIVCRLIYRAYICIVFFIVLDFKVNKGWSTAVLLFYLYAVNKLYKADFNSDFFTSTFIL